MRGFTLLETIAVILIIALVVVIIIPNIKKFGSSQDSQKELTDLISVLRQAQTNAQNGVRCSDATASAKWRVVFNSSTQYKLDAVCTDGTTIGSYSKPAVNLKSALLTTACNNGVGMYGVDKSIGFSSITVGISQVIYPDPTYCSLTGPYTITLTAINTSDVYSIIIDKGGSIYQN